MLIFGGIAAVLVAIGVTVFWLRGSAGREREPEWQPEQELLSELGPATSLGGYSIRPPADLVLEDTHRSDKSLSVRWIAPSETPEARLRFSVVFDQKYTEEYEPDIVTDRSPYIFNPTRETIAYPDANVDRGRISGVRFIRIHGGTAANGARFIYLAYFDGTKIQIRGETIEPPESLAFRRLETAARTFRRDSRGGDITTSDG